MRVWPRRLAAATLVVALAWSLTACEDEVRGQLLYAGDVTAADASSWVSEQVTIGDTGLLVTVNGLDDAGVAAPEYWQDRLPALAEATGGYDVVVLTIGVSDLEAGALPADLDGRVDAVAAAATAVASTGVLWATLDGSVPGHEEAAAAFNAALARAATAHPTLHLLDFGAELASHPTYRADGGLRWTTEGEQAFGTLVGEQAARLLDPPVPAVAITTSVAEAEVAAGTDVHVHVAVSNPGETTLHGVVVTDPAAPGCAGPVPDLEPGGSAAADCVAPTTNADVPIYTNVATVDTDETGPVESAPATVTVTGTNIVRLKVRWRGDGPARPLASVRLRCTGASPAFEQTATFTDATAQDLTVPADRPSCSARLVAVKGAPTTSYEASSSTATTAVTATAARITFATVGGERAKVVVAELYPGACPAGQASC